MVGGLGGFFLPIAFGLMMDFTHVWTSCFMLLFLIVAVALVWMHFSIRHMEREALPADVRDQGDLPEIQWAQESRRSDHQLEMGVQ